MYTLPGILKHNTKQFEMVLRGGISGESGGVMMFTSNAVAKDEAKIEVMKKVYEGQGKPGKYTIDMDSSLFRLNELFLKDR